MIRRDRPCDSSTITASEKPARSRRASTSSRRSSAAIAVHTIRPDESDHASGTVELAFEADEQLEEVRARLGRAGFSGAVIVDESHGRSLRIIDPEGVLIQVNEFDRELYL